MRDTTAEKAAVVQAAPADVQTNLQQTLASSPQYVFPLQTTTWHNMQMAVKAGLQIPIAQGDFTTKYGVFDDTADVQGAITIFTQLNDLLTKFGDPTSIAAEISKYTSMTDPPDAVFAHAVWLSQQTSLAAQDINNLISGLQDCLAPGTPVADKLEALKEICLDQGGISDKATTMKGKADTFNKKVANYYSNLNTTLTNTDVSGPDSLAKYLAKEDNVLAAAKQKVTDLSNDITSLQSQVATANQQYLAFTISASLAPVACMLPPLFIFGGIIDAAVCGSLAGVWKGKLDALNTQLQQEQVEEQKKAQLVADLQVLNDHADMINTTGLDFLNAVGSMVDGWATLTSQLADLIGNLSPDKLDDEGTFLLVTTLKGAVTSWNNVMSAADQFRNAGFLVQQAPPSS
jgi:hypothetical protein